jgi:hypothetical protein
MKKIIALALLALLCIFAVQFTIAMPVENTRCVDLTACIDGSDFFTVENGVLTITHGNYDPIGQHSGCSADLRDVIKLSSNPNYPDAGIGSPVVIIDIQFDKSYLLDGSLNYPMPFEYLMFQEDNGNRGPVTLNEHTITADDNGYGGSTTYKITMCGILNQNHDIPEFGVIGASVLGAFTLGIIFLKRKN